MTLNGVIALISPNSIALQTYYVTVVEDDLYCLQNIVVHFWPKLTHPAVQSLCDSRTTCSNC